MEVHFHHIPQWFEWIDIFRCLVHQSGRPAGEKLTILKRNFKGSCQDLVHGLGGGEEAYKEGSLRLKETCRRRDLLRAVHLQIIEKLEPGRNPTTLKRYAEKIRTHLFDLSRLREESNMNLIERICVKLNIQDQLAWTEQRGVNFIELNDFTEMALQASIGLPKRPRSGRRTTAN